MTKFSGKGDKAKKAVLQGLVIVTGEKDPEKLPQQQRAARQRSNCLYILSFLFILTGLSVGGAASYYLYKSLHPTTYATDCTFVLETNDSLTTWIGQHVEVSKDDDRESIQVPKLDDSDEAMFVHDFRQNISVIKDFTDMLCYVLPLDRELIPVPRDLFDLIYGLNTDRYVLDAERIQTEYEVVFPAMTAEILEDKYGTYVSSLCAGYESHDLRELDTQEVTTTTMRAFQVERTFTVYPGGRFMVKYVIHR